MADIFTKEWHLRHDDEIWTDDDNYVASGTDTEVTNYIVALHNNKLSNTSTKPSLADVLKLPDITVQSNEPANAKVLDVFGVKCFELKVSHSVLDDGVWKDRFTIYTYTGADIRLNVKPLSITLLSDTRLSIAIITGEALDNLIQDRRLKADKLQSYIKEMDR